MLKPRWIKCSRRTFPGCGCKGHHLDLPRLRFGGKRTRRLTRSAVANQRGIALPMALFVLLLLSVFMIAFLRLGTSEVVIANNQLAHSRAFWAADSGTEFARWALNNPAASGVVPPATRTEPVGTGEAVTVTLTPEVDGTVSVTSVGTAEGARSMVTVTLAPTGTIPQRWLPVLGSWREIGG